MTFLKYYVLAALYAAVFVVPAKASGEPADASKKMLLMLVTWVFV